MRSLSGLGDDEMNRDPIIETEGLTKVYGSHRAVNGITMRVSEGEIFGFLGPNGAGKTTTLLMLLGLSEPSGGKALVCGFDPSRDALRVKEKVGYLPENVGFYDDMNALQNMQFVARLNRIADRVSKPRIKELLDTVGLLDVSTKKVGTYSKGMRQRLGIAEVLVKDPRVVFLDEPTVGLDPDGTNRMLDLIRSLSRDKKITVFFSSHLLDQVEKVCDRVGIMIHGDLVAAGKIADLAREKFGVDSGEYTLEEIYMKYFKEA